MNGDRKESNMIKSNGKKVTILAREKVYQHSIKFKPISNSPCLAAPKGPQFVIRVLNREEGEQVWRPRDNPW